MIITANPDTYYREKGLIGKRKGRKPRIEWVRKAVETCHTQAEWQELIKSMTPKDQVDALLKVQPKINVNENTGLTVTLVIDGLKQKAIEGQVIDERKALTAPDPEEVD